MSRFTGTVFLLPFLAVVGFVFLSPGPHWLGEWNASVALATGSTVLTGPVAAALAAHLALGQAQLAAVSATTVRGQWVPVLAALVAWRIAVVAYAVTVVVALGATRIGVHGGPLEWWVLGIGPVVLAVCVLAGALAVKVAPHRLTVLLVGPLVFAASAYGWAPFSELLRPGPATGSLAGLRYDVQVWLLQVLALCCLAVLEATLLLSWRKRLVRGVVVLGSLLALTAVAVPLRADGSDRFTLSDERPTACAGSAPRVCVAPSNRRELRRTAAAMNRGAAVLRAAGAAVPGTYEALLPGRVPPVRVGLVSVLAGEGGWSDEAMARQNLLTPAACPAWTDRTKPPHRGGVRRSGADRRVDDGPQRW